jgi:hypothetical protein
MKTRIVKVSSGYVPQLWLYYTTKRFWFWNKKNYTWYGVDRYGIVYRPLDSQLRDCVFPTTEAAEEAIKVWKYYEDRKYDKKDDKELLSSD